MKMKTASSIIAGLLVLVSRGAFAQIEPTPTRIPAGSGCAFSAQCEDGLICFEGVCFAPFTPTPAPTGTPVPEGSGCASTPQCDVGLVCENSICVGSTPTPAATSTPIPEGGGCALTSQCEAGLVCAGGVCAGPTPTATFRRRTITPPRPQITFGPPGGFPSLPVPPPPTARPPGLPKPPPWG
jgi:hypothetical protein